MKSKSSAIEMEKILSLVKFHEKQGIPYEMKITGATYDFASDLQAVSGRDIGFNISELWVINAIKSGLEPKNAPNVTSRDVEFRHINRQQSDGEKITCIEFDLKRAYYNIAIKQGVISEELAAKIEKSNVSNASLRIALGSLAKVTDYFSYDGAGDVVHTEEVSEYAGYFYGIAKECGQIMGNFKQLKGYVAFYTDAVLFDIKHEKEFSEMMESMNVSYAKEGEFECIYDRKANSLEIIDIGSSNYKTIKREKQYGERAYRRKWNFGKKAPENFWD